MISQFLVTLLTIIFVAVMNMALIKILTFILPVSLDNQKLTAIQSKDL